MVCTGDEATWPSQISHHKCQQLLHDPALLEQFLQEWLTSTAVPTGTEPPEIPDFNHIKGTIQGVINNLLSKEELPLEALCTLLQRTTLAQLEEEYSSNITQANQGTTGPSMDEGTGGEW